MATSIGFDIVAHDRASRTLDNVGRSADRSGSKFKTMGKAVKIAALGLGAGLLVGGRALAGMTKNAAEDEAAQRRLALAMKNSVGASKAQVASVEEWISAQGVATGVTDDEMRPSMQRLIESTGSVSKAQRQMKIAMDVSAGTGKSLSTVTAAMMKANNGTTASLSKLGLKTKDAKGNTLSLDAAMKSMANTFGGQAAAKAQTLDGKMARLQLILDETKESIGAKLLPVLTRFAGWFLSDGIPKLEQFGQKLQSVGEKLQKAAGFAGDHKTALTVLGGAIAAVVAVTKIHTAVMAVQAAGGLVPLLKGTKLVAAATRAYAAVQWVLNAAMRANPIGIVITVLMALGAAVVIAYKKSDTFRSIVDRAWSVVKKGASIMWAAIRPMLDGFRSALTAVGKAGTWLWNNALAPAFRFIVGGIGKVMGFWASMLRSLSKVPGFGWAASAAGMLENAANKATSLARGIREIPPSKSVAVNVQYSYSGLKSPTRGRDGMLSYARGTNFHPGGLAIVGEEGPELVNLPRGSKVTPSARTRAAARQISQPTGEAIMDGLIRGIESKWVPASKLLDRVTDRVRSTGKKIKDLMGARREFAGGFSSFTGGSMFGLDMSGTSGDADAMLNYQQAELDKTRQLRVDVARLTKAKLSDGLLKELQASGESGIAQIHALAQGTDQQIRLAGSLHAQTQAELRRTGANAAQALYGDDIKAAQREQRLAKKIGDAVRHELHGRDPDEVVFRLRGDELVGVLKRTKRVRGNKPLGIS